MAFLSGLASRFNSVDEYAQFVDQHMVNQTAQFRAYKAFLDEEFFGRVEEARQELHTSMRAEFASAVAQEGQRVQASKQQEATAWGNLIRQQFENDFNVQVALNKKSLEAELQQQLDQKLASKDGVLGQKDLEIAELKSALANSQSSNKDLTSRMKEQEQICSKHVLTAENKIRELEGAQAASTSSLNSAKYQIGQLDARVQANQRDIQARDSEVRRYRQEAGSAVAAQSAAQADRDSISLRLNLVTGQRDGAQQQLTEAEKNKGTLQAENRRLQTDLDAAGSKNKDLQTQLSGFEGKSQKSEQDWAEARTYVQNLEKEKESLQREVKALTAVSSKMEQETPSRQQVGVSGGDVAAEEADQDDSDLGRPVRRRCAKKPAAAKTDAKSNRIGKKKAAAKTTKVVNVEAVKARDLETMEEFAEGNFIFSNEEVKPRPEWHPAHPAFDQNVVTIGHKDFNPQALRYVTEVQFELQQERFQAEDDSVEQSKTTNESFVDQISNWKW